MDAVIFDLFGTLVPNLPPERWRRSLNEMAAALELDADIFTAEWHGTFAARMHGGMLDGPGMYEPILRALGRPAHPAGMARADEIRRATIVEALTPKDDALATLEALRARGFKLGLATDCSSDTPHLLDGTELGAFFEVRAVSAHLRTTKPDPRMYHHVMSGLGVRGERCLYVGDGNSEELPGAKRHGMTTVWVDNGSVQYWRDRYTPGGDHRIERLAEVLELL